MALGGQSVAGSDVEEDMKRYWLMSLMAARGWRRSVGVAVAQSHAEPKPKTLAVLPFVGGNDKENKLAERMRFLL